MSHFVDRSLVLLARTPLPGLWHKLRKPLLWLLLLGYFVFAITLLVLRFSILPHIADYRGDIEQAISRAINLPVSIARIDADWQGLRPRLQLDGFKVSDRQGRTALSFDRVEAVVGWSSLLYFEPHLHRLEIDNPQLSMRRETNGDIFVAGLPIKPDDSKDSRLPDWVLSQGQIVIRNARLQWDDALRNAPTLILNKVNIDLYNSSHHHRIGVTAEPPPALATRLDLRGDVRGSNLSDFSSWKGRIYTELDYADLAIWRRWVDYPISLPRGSGGIRLWLDFAQSKVTSVTADLALANVQLRLGRQLPMLDLRELHGRLSAAHDGDSYTVSGKKLTLLTTSTPGSPAGLALGPLDFNTTLRLDESGRAQSMRVQFNSLDLGKLNALASYLPLPQEYEKQLGELGLEGRIDGLNAYWDEPGKRYALKGDFHDLGIAANGKLPGVHGFSGSINGDENGGTLMLASSDAVLSLPAVFPEPDIALQKLDAKLHWQRTGTQYEVNIDAFHFANVDAEGSVSGRYHGALDHAGDIDLSAQLTRGDGTAVWRYLPLAVGKVAREWVQQSITSGHSDDVKLTLKGDLAKFPFRNGDGTFKVLIKAQDATIRPAPGWPDIRGIDGEVDFIGAGMKITAHKGQVLGANVVGAKADIVDLDAHDNQTLTITGKAKGPTQEFLSFIEASPVGARIGHFTKSMSANGNGELDLKLLLTLNNIDHSSVEGNYIFDNNRLQAGPSLPPLTEAKGHLEFTGDSVTVHDARANMLGAPLAINIGTDKDGQISVLADGQFNIPALHKLYPLPLLDQLFGSARWKGRFAIRKDNVDVRITSDLVGLSSSLPEPFNKAATDAMDFRFERKLVSNGGRSDKGTSTPPTPTPNSSREILELSLGKLVRAQLTRTAGTSDFQRGYVAIGNGADAVRLPDSGTLLTADLPKVDIDFWRNMFAMADDAQNKGQSGQPATSSAMENPFTQINLRANEVVVLNRSLQNVRFAARQNGGLWKGDFSSQGVNAMLEWTPGSDGKPGRLSGRIPQLTIPNPNQQMTEIAHLQDSTTGQLPALALVIDNLNLRGQNWGTVTLDAENRNSYWYTKFSVKNDDGDLEGDGKWLPDPDHHDTQINFQLKAKSLEKLLARAGYADTIRRGTADLEGDLTWNGPPFSIDYPSLKGNLKVHMQNGQFKKLEPGIGRLLGVLSLQSIPRRISLDFRDIFSEGFAFDSIRGDVKVDKGIMETPDLAIAGPAAKVHMNGTVNLPDETQDLHVHVQPVLGDTLAVGAMIASPAIGAVAWLAHKVLQSPIDKAFAFEYHVTGSWENPQVVKVNTGHDINKEITEEVLKQSAINKESAGTTATPPPAPTTAIPPATSTTPNSPATPATPATPEPK